MIRKTIPSTNVIAMFRTKPRRSPRRIDQTANWQVNELVIRMTVATMIGPSGSRMSLNDVRRPRLVGRAGREVGGEEAGEEHHLGGDEQEHPEDRVADPPLGVPATARRAPRRGACVTPDCGALAGRRRPSSSAFGASSSSARRARRGRRARGGRRTAGARSGSPGRRSKLYGGGGDEVAHSRVLPSHGIVAGDLAVAERDEDVPDERQHRDGDDEAADRRQRGSSRSSRRRRRSRRSAGACP